MLSIAPGLRDIIHSYNRISPMIHKTPVLSSGFINNFSESNLYFKCENFQKVGAFKFRGAANAVLQLPDELRMKGVATHSSGNHAQALALAARMQHISAFIVMPENAPSVKRNAVRDYGAKIITCKPTLSAREQTLNQVIKETGAVFIHPYNNYDIICGQATCAYELMGEISNLDAIVAPVGGGGLLSGTCLAAHFLNEFVEVFGAEPAGASDAYQSVNKGEIVPSVEPRTIADGLLTSLGDKTFPIIREHVQGIILVDESEIVNAMRLLWERMKIVVEPSGAVALAAVLHEKEYFKNRKVGIILSGGNVDLAKLPFE
jgi:threonine dehydratase